MQVGTGYGETTGRLLQRADHIPMRNARIIIDRTNGHKAKPFIKTQGMRLRAEFGLCQAGMAVQLCQGGPDQGRAKAGSPRLGQHTDAADHAHLTADQQPCRTYRTAIEMGEKMDRLTIQIIKLIRLADALFLNEDQAAQQQAGGNVAAGGNLDHAK